VKYFNAKFLQDLRDLFEKVGKIKECVVKTSTAGKPLGYGFVTFINRKDVDEAIEVRKQELFYFKT
jgi:RNA recognition motif-containing protein